MRQNLAEKDNFYKTTYIFIDTNMSFLNTEFCTFLWDSPHDHCGLI